MDGGRGDLKEGGALISKTSLRRLAWAGIRAVEEAEAKAEAEAKRTEPIAGGRI